VPSRPGPPRADLILLAVAVAAMSTAAPLIRAAAAPALAVAFWRNALAVGVLAPFAARRGGGLGAMAGDERRLSTVAGVLLAGHFAAWIPSLSFTTVASSVALVSTQPVWAALMARARGRAVPAATWAGIGLALAGVVAVTGVDLAVSGRALFGDVLALAGGVLAAAYVTVGAEVRRTVGTVAYATVCYAVAAALLLAVAAGSGAALGGYPAKTWVALAAIAAGPQLLGHTVTNRVLRTVSATTVSVAILFEIVGATALARVFFAETPPAGIYPAAVLLAAGVVLVVRSAEQPVVSDTPVVE
jgi:drug/metabolite transporter (DMT)-like permease